MRKRFVSKYAQSKKFSLRNSFEEHPFESIYTGLLLLLIVTCLVGCGSREEEVKIKPTPSNLTSN